MRAAVAILALTVAAWSQQNVPHAGYVYPAGGRQDSSFEVTVGGQYLTGVSDALISGGGVQASVVKYIKPLNPGQANMLREQMQELLKKQTAGTALTAAEQRTIADIRARLAEFVRRPASPAIAETVLLQVMVARDAAPGKRELRLAVGGGLSNPIDLWIGQLPEVARPAVKVPPEFAVVNGATPPNRFIARQPATPAAKITLPAIVNGQMMPGKADRYRFTASKGQRIVIATQARELIPYIADAVPGWFQAVVTLRDAAGRELASADHFRFHPDPVLYSEIPADGEYEVEIHDSIYRGREDFVYRIAIGELPFLTGVFPLGGKAGAKAAKIEAHGFNLPAATVAPETKAAGVHPVSVRKGDWMSNEVPFAVDTLPEAAAKDAATRREKAQKVKLPVIVNGRVARAGETEFFRIDGHAGEEIAAEVYARRLDSPLDSTLRLTDAAGSELAFNDDFEDKGAGRLTHQADSRILVKLPAKGAYYLQLTDAERKGGPDYAYRLRIAHPQPDFELRVSPASLSLRAGATAPVSVYAMRRDGFAGEIALKLKDAPAGFAMTGAAIPAGQDQARFTVTAPRTGAGTPAAIRLEGSAEIGGHDVRHFAVPAEDMMQAFAYRHLVAESEWIVRVVGSGAAGPGWKPASEKPVRLSAGSSTTVQVTVPPRLAPDVRLALNEPPEGIEIRSVTQSPNGVAVVVAAGEKVKPGLKGNLIVDAFVERPAPAQGPTARRRQPMGVLPAIPFEVVAN